MSLGDFLDRLTGLLDGAGVPYMLAGSYASSFHGEPRTTQDVDLVVHANAAQIRRLIAAVPVEDYYVDLDTALDALRRGSQFNIIDLQTGWKADIIPRRNRAFSRSEFDRRQRVAVDRRPLWVASPEDVIIAKLEWASKTGSDRQLRDVAGILRARRSTLDYAYIERWVSELGLASQWAVVAPKPSSDDES